ncbi:MAG: ABC transporter substrate-binding protein, partial [Ilumatobacteraceae bacterium]
ALAATLGLLAAACGSDDKAADTTVAPSPVSAAPAPANSTATPVATDATPAADGEPIKVVLMWEVKAPDQLANLTGVLNCNPSDTSREPSKTFIEAYTAANGSAPDLIGMVTYDSINLMAAAILEAGSTDHAAVADALRSITFTDGACAPEWKADAAQVFNHQQVVVSYDADGKAVTQASVAIEPAS